MAVTTHLKSLQALELAVRTGSFKAAAETLGITPAAIGQSIRSLEDYLGTDLLVRGRSGLQPTRELELALSELQTAFKALDNTTEILDFQRTCEIHIVADNDWAELWLLPNMITFQENNPNILFCVNGSGDIPVRLGSPDVRVSRDPDRGEVLFQDLLVPVTGPDNPRRIADRDPVNQMEGMPLLHLKEQIDSDDHPGWVDWFRAFGHRESGTDRGVHYTDARLALDAVRQNVGFLVCGLPLVLCDLQEGVIVRPFPLCQHLVAPHPYRLRLRSDAIKRPQLVKFVEWLRITSCETQRELEAFKH